MYPRTTSHCGSAIPVANACPRAAAVGNLQRCGQFRKSTSLQQRLQFTNTDTDLPNTYMAVSVKWAHRECSERA
jgi:hypothetical protein